MFIIVKHCSQHQLDLKEGVKLINYHVEYHNNQKLSHIHMLQAEMDHQIHKLTEINLMVILLKMSTQDVTIQLKFHKDMEIMSIPEAV